MDEWDNERKEILGKLVKALKEVSESLKGDGYEQSIDTGQLKDIKDELAKLNSSQQHIADGIKEELDKLNVVQDAIAKEIKALHDTIVSQAKKHKK